MKSPLPQPTRKPLLLAGLLAAIASPAFANTVRIDFGRDNGADGNPTSSPDSNGNHWNNVTGGFDVAPGMLAATLVTTDNSPTAIGVKVAAGWKANGSNNGGLLAPDPALLGDVAIDTATQDYFFLEGAAARSTMTISGLDPAKLYRFRFFGTRATDDFRETTYQITAASGVDSVALQTSGIGVGDDGIYNGNDDAFAELDGIQSNTTGRIELEVSVTGGAFGYLGVLEIIEGAAVAPIDPPVTSTGALLIDFGRTDGVNGNLTSSPDINGRYWNNLIGAGGIPNGLSATHLVTTDNAPTGIGVTMGSGWDSNGMLNGGLLAPDPALLGDIAIATATQDYFFVGAAGGIVTLEISGLNPAKLYTFRLFGTRETPDVRTGTYKISAGSGDSSVTLQSSGAGIGDGGYDGNNNTVAELTNVQSTTSTTVKLELTATSGGFAYLGAMEIVEGADAPVIEPPVSATGIVRIDFGRSDATNGNATSSPDSNGNHWNNMVGAGLVPAGRAITNLVTTDNVPTTIDVTMGEGWDSNGILTGGLQAPDPALLGDMAIPTATQDFFFIGGTGNTRPLTIDGLDPAKRYDFRFFGTRQTAEVRETTYTLTGADGPASTSLQTSGPGIGEDGIYDANDNTIAEITGIAPNSNGSAQLDVTVAGLGFAYLGVMEIVELPPAGPFQVTEIVVTRPDTVFITFNSTPGNLYDVKANTDLGEFTSIGQVVASGTSTVFTRGGVNLLTREFFQVEDLGMAPPVFSEDFEGGGGGFTTEDKSAGGAGSDWQPGAPDSFGFADNIVSSGNGGSVNCWGTDIADPGFVVAGTVTCLRSPALDLTGLAGASLTFAETLDLEPGDLAEVWIVEAASSNVVAGPIHVSTDADITRSDWAPVAPISLPAAAFAQPIRLEWRFTKVGAGSDYIGWYVDDVVVSH